MPVARGRAGVRQEMHKFKEGTLHSGSSKGPIVKSRKQAIAISLNKAGLSRKSRKIKRFEQGGQIEGPPLPRPDPRYQISDRDLRGVPPNLAAGWRQQMQDLRNIKKGYAKGGRAKVGEPVIVGERGPEVFVPDRPGTVIPNNRIKPRPLTIGGAVKKRKTAMSQWSGFQK